MGAFSSDGLLSGRSNRSAHSVPRVMNERAFIRCTRRLFRCNSGEKNRIGFDSVGLVHRRIRSTVITSWHALFGPAKSRAIVTRLFSKRRPRAPPKSIAADRPVIFVYTRPRASTILSLVTPANDN